jgi:hypothetical protein
MSEPVLEYFLPYNHRPVQGVGDRLQFRFEVSAG